MRTKSCIDETGSLTQQTKTDFDCHMKWMTTVQTDVILCNYREGYVTKTHTRHAISNPADISDCNYGSGYCFHPKQGIAVTYVACARPTGTVQVRTSWNIN